jgi:hypothetical protein
MILVWNSPILVFNVAQRFAALRGCELRNRVFSVTTKFLAKDKREFTT